MLESPTPDAREGDCQMCGQPRQEHIPGPPTAPQIRGVDGATEDRPGSCLTRTGVHEHRHGRAPALDSGGREALTAFAQVVGNAVDAQDDRDLRILGGVADLIENGDYAAAAFPAGSMHADGAGRLHAALCDLAAAPSSPTAGPLDRLRDLREDWDSYGGKPTTEAALRAAESASWVPVPDGGAQWELHAGGREIEVEIGPDGSVVDVSVEPSPTAGGEGQDTPTPPEGELHVLPLDKARRHVLLDGLSRLTYGFAVELADELRATMCTTCRGSGFAPYVGGDDAPCAVCGGSGFRPAGTGRWRTGRRVGRTLYLDDVLVGVVDTPELAAQVVAAVNASSPTGDRERQGNAAMLAEFHRVFAHPDTDALWLRPTLHDEEHAELIEALESGDRAAIARELADVVYIAYGTALVHRIDLDVAVREVHRANLSKVGDDGQPIRRDDGKILKGPNFRPPDMTAALAGSPSPPSPGDREREALAVRLHERFGQDRIATWDDLDPSRRANWLAEAAELLAVIARANAASPSPTAGSEVAPMPDDKPTYAAIDAPAFVNGREVLLAARRGSDPEQRVVIALMENEARWLHADGRLLFWEPRELPAPASSAGEGSDDAG
jgi:NTP pyrophosphatase (non-canonical NTP hydrolase)